MREHFIYYCRRFAERNDLYCITNDNVSNTELKAKETLNVSYGRNNPLGYFSLRKLNRMKHFIRSVDPNVVYVFTHHATSILLAGFLKKYRLIYQVHDPNPHEGVGLISRLILKTQLKQYAKAADRLVVAGEAVKQQVLEACRAEEKKVAVIPFAVLDNYINDAVEPVSEKIDVLFFGRIEPYKGLDLLIEAAERLGKDTLVYIAGGGSIQKAYPNIQSIPENVKILGYLENDRLIAYIKASKVIVLPYREASGTMTVCQCFYYGRPVVVTKTGVLPEYVGDGGVVLADRDADKLAEIIDHVIHDEPYRMNLSRNAKARYESFFTMENACDAHQALFEALAAIRK